METTSSNRTRSEQVAFDLIRHRKQGYAHTFKTDDRFNRIVLDDLRRFCRGGETTYHPDPRMHDILTGRREVLLRILNHLNLTEDELYKLLALGK